ncbi:hypothetical protein L6452_28574 [Arctium lappa]|uniref:Uncharacterized protein n=1 Tax=Arctium lappa TaxID=4217 RepID=A0ACB8ZZ29_ARCLA|nr:hypothetical protein L6452_28574 [Arctium lappa]
MADSTKSKSTNLRPEKTSGTDDTPSKLPEKRQVDGKSRIQKCINFDQVLRKDMVDTDLQLPDIEIRDEDITFKKNQGNPSVEEPNISGGPGNVFGPEKCDDRDKSINGLVNISRKEFKPIVNEESGDIGIATSGLHQMGEEKIKKNGPSERVSGEGNTESKKDKSVENQEDLEAFGSMLGINWESISGRKKENFKRMLLSEGLLADWFVVEGDLFAGGLALESWMKLENDLMEERFVKGLSRK